jgi:hypothetical protein
MNQLEIQSSTASREDASAKAHSFIIGPCGVRYQVKDGARSVAFYWQQLGFKVDQQNLPHSRRSLSAISNGFSAVLVHPALVRCLMADAKNPADGIASSSKWQIFQLGSRH